jgi:hypothetical protein
LFTYGFLVALATSFLPRRNTSSKVWSDILCRVLFPWKSACHDERRVSSKIPFLVPKTVPLSQNQQEECHWNHTFFTRHDLASACTLSYDLNKSQGGKSTWFWRFI